MSVKNAVAVVLKAMRKARGLSQKNLAEVSSRTYVSKLERGQSSPTLEMMSTLSSPLGLSPLGLVALTLATETGQSIRSLINHVENEFEELVQAGALKELQIPTVEPSPQGRGRNLPKSRHTLRSLGQTEFCFAD
ncbi:helix-turn-helix domain-containing protein [Pseudomonas sp. C1C7]|uniref:helix-turn-helix domain-containing protein n=1 Tax=Pseudomonas sp. C1C7 TaxID=2735272 RepID=UPI001586AF8F|nr:helix-turn-helix domain-containing protein [Pseudomonas sp. C1C7]NUT76876.1 helix-turn-helix domain-containing protein [Pseudomonas sp. C1C7]